MGILIEMFISNMERTRNDRREKLFNNKWQKINKKHYGQTEKIMFTDNEKHKAE